MHLTLHRGCGNEIGAYFDSVHDIAEAVGLFAYEYCDRLSADPNKLADKLEEGNGG